MRTGRGTNRETAREREKAFTEPVAHCPTFQLASQTNREPRLGSSTQSSSSRPLPTLFPLFPILIRPPTLPPKNRAKRAIPKYRKAITEEWDTTTERERERERKERRLEFPIDFTHGKHQHSAHTDGFVIAGDCINMNNR